MNKEVYTPQYWFTGDSHFGHVKILQYQPETRGHFKSIKDHDECLIDNWNKCINPKDYVFHVGDFAFGSQEYCKRIRNRLNGHVSAIPGNHDSAECIKKTFACWKENIHCTINEQKLFLSHYAHLSWPRIKYSWHIFGHSHGSLNKWIEEHLPNHRMLDVGIDCWNLLPVNFNQIKEIMDKKPFTPLDHHD